MQALADSFFPVTFLHEHCDAYVKENVTPIEIGIFFAQNLVLAHGSSGMVCKIYEKPFVNVRYI